MSGDRMTEPGAPSSLPRRSEHAPALDGTAERLLYIDGLRAIAILCVIGFHAGLS